MTEQREDELRTSGSIKKALGKALQERTQSCYHDVGIAYANIFPFNGCIVGGGTFSAVIEKIGDEAEPDTILTERSSIPTGVAGDADEAGEDDADTEGDGVSGVPGT